MNTRTMLPRLGALAASVALMSACSGGMSEDPSTAEGEQPATTQQEPSDGGGMASEEGGEDMDGMDPAAAAPLRHPHSRDESVSAAWASSASWREARRSTIGSSRSAVPASGTQRRT